MNGIAVDPARRTVTVGPGAVWGDGVTGYTRLPTE
jgi:hypothetical protein